MGWRQTSLILAVGALIVLVPLNFLFQRHKPQDIGLLPDGEERAPVTDDDERSPVDERIVNPIWATTEWTVLRALRTARFWWLLLSVIAGLYAWYAVQVHQTRYLIDIGISAETAAIALGLVGLSGIGGQIVIGYFSDRVGREWAWTVSLLGYMATYGLLLLLDSYPFAWMAYAMVIVQGFLGYGLATVFGTVPFELFAGKRYGVIFGLIAAAASSGAALGPYVTGLFYDAQESYDQAFGAAMVICAVSILAMWMAGPRQIRTVPGRVAG